MNKKKNGQLRYKKTFRNEKKKIPSLFRSNILSRALLLWLASFLVLMSFFFSEVMRHDNYLEIFPVELIFPTAMYAFTAFLIAGVYIKFGPATLPYKLIAVLLLSLLMVNYDDRLTRVSELFRAVLPIMPSPPNDMMFFSLLFIVLTAIIIGLFCVWLEKKAAKLKSLKLTHISQGLFVLIFFIFVSQAINVGRVLPQMISQSSAIPPELEKSKKITSNASNEKPDIYYIVLDRYTNNKVLQTQLGFDNSEFTSHLKEIGFQINEEAYANYPYTAMSIASTINARYNDDIIRPYTNSSTQSRALYHNLIRESSVIKALKEEGYKFYNVGTEYGATNNMRQADSDYTFQYALNFYRFKKKVLRGIEAQAFIKSPFYSLSKSDFRPSPLKITELDNLGFIREQLRILDKLANTKNPGGRLIMAHLLIPHPPYYSNADGSLSPWPQVDNLGKTNRDKYLGYLQFGNTQIKELVNSILKNSAGKTVIILNSDEGEYPDHIYNSFSEPYDPLNFKDDSFQDMRTWADEWIKLKFGILQALYMPKVEREMLSQISSVNIFRVLLNEYFGHQHEYLPDCHFALTSGKSFIYQDITHKIKGTTESFCNKLQTN